MSDGITNEETARLLENPILHRIEKNIATAAGRKITDPMVGFRSTELYLANLTVSRVLSILAKHEQDLTHFGIELIRFESKEPFGGDYASREAGQQEDEVNANTVIRGISHGFGLTYLCYYSFLLDRNYDGFEKYAEVRCLAGGKKFISKLKRVYAKLRDA
jgi:hypothetical protein